VRSAGIREARQNLSVLLEYVEKGHEILITDRGRPVARLVAPLPLSVKPFPGRGAFRRGMPRLEPPLSETLGAPESLAAGGPKWPPQIPGPLYLDATALARLYLPEPGSATFDRVLRGRRDLTVSELAVTELMAGFAGRRGGERMKSAAGQLQGAVLEDLESGCFRRVELSPSTHRAAERLALPLADASAAGPARALHLALAMTAGVAGIVSFDSALARGAEALGLLALPAR
jgi:prevent-host-death family protein